ncbi:hypothetical protein C2857_000390 [Epichloe festucae Fl1]|uniref:DUF985 domain-containing protein n=1 Tax=Epichloe festucae (strain Fl1) TaxID=877507 RepID=A0A7U3Q176_EPIFF|nr:hypothetical protein C2857_000390 [Epichloe festucae Fl1]
MLLPTLCYIAALALPLGVAVAATDSNARPIDGRSAKEVIDRLRLAPNVEGGYYAQTFEDPSRVVGGGNRSVSTLIYYLLEGAEGHSKWHRVDAAEVWHYYAGAPLTLSLSRDDGAPVAEHVLGPDIFHGQAPQVVVPGHVWQRAQSAGSWTLVGTTVAPGFTAGGFELAPPGWKPRDSC